LKSHLISVAPYNRLHGHPDILVFSSALTPSWNILVRAMGFQKNRLRRATCLRTPMARSIPSASI